MTGLGHATYPQPKGTKMSNRIVLTSAASDGMAPRTLPESVKRHHLPFIRAKLILRAQQEREELNLSPRTVRAWEVTEAGTFLFPPIMEITR